MVRICSLPFRYVAKNCGADIVYSEELIDKKLLLCERLVNEETQIVEYRVSKDHRAPSRATASTVAGAPSSPPVYSTSPLLEDRPLVLQMGTACADLAVRAAEKMFPDYDAIDVNCGCPKHFSVHSGMGAKLLTDQENMLRILSSLVRAVGQNSETRSKSVTCKIRLLPTVEETQDLLRRIEQTGVNAVAIHARYIPQRPRDKAHLHLLSQLSSAVQIPVIANGDCFEHEDIESIRQLTGCSSVMIARGAMWNPSIFSSDEQLRREWSDPHVRALHMLDSFDRLGATMSQTRYLIQRAYGDESGDGQFMMALTKALTIAEMRSLIQIQQQKPKKK